MTKPLFPLAELSDLPEDMKAKILAVQEKAGFVPNVFLALAHRPDEWRAFFAYHDALMLRDGGPKGLSKADREMIVTATSAVNHCLYCVVAHGAILRILSKQPLLADQVAINYRKAEISARQQAILDFALKVCQHSHELNADDVQKLMAHELDEEAVWDIVSITAFFGLSNRLANGLGIMPNPEFYTMGRVSKSKA
ncbi:MAG: hypothetical protein RLZZ502_1807 [Pseudomonadota bacterium]|jgi:uncharacterized peroxidase-related enzyme